MTEPVNNEPQPMVKGGVMRASRLIDRSEFPALQVRERVLKLLRAHCPDSRGDAKFEESDYAVVRLIAQEGAISNAEPAVRYKAIAALASSSTAENLNLLIDLAEFGEDFYVRGHAVLALGLAGTQIALPTIARHLNATERFEQAAAASAVALIARKSSIESVAAHASLLDDRARTAVQQILSELGRPRKQGEARITPQRRNPTPR
jgi:HEAT repeat protein